MKKKTIKELFKFHEVKALKKKWNWYGGGGGGGGRKKGKLPIISSRVIAGKSTRRSSKIVNLEVNLQNNGGLEMNSGTVERHYF